MVAGPALFKQLLPGAAIAGEADVVDQRVEPDIGDEAGIERQLDSPGEAALGSRDAEVACDLGGSVPEFRLAEIGSDEILPGLEETGQPLRALGEPKIPVLLVQQDDFAPLGSELAVGPAFLVGEELLLAHAVVAAVGGLVEPVTLLEVGEDALDRLLVQGRGRGGPAIVGNPERLPEGEEFLGDPVGELLRGNPLALRALLNLLAMLVDSREEENLAATLSLEACQDVGEDLLVGVADVGRGVRVIDRRGDEERFHVVGVSLSPAGAAGGFSSLAILPPQERILAFTPADSASAI